MLPEDHFILQEPISAPQVTAAVPDTSAPPASEGAPPASETAPRKRRWDNAPAAAVSGTETISSTVSSTVSDSGVVAPPKRVSRWGAASELGPSANAAAAMTAVLPVATSEFSLPDEIDSSAYPDDDDSDAAKLNKMEKYFKDLQQKEGFLCSEVIILTFEFDFSVIRRQ